MAEKITIRQQLCFTLLELLAKKPINDITVTQLVKVAHVSRSSFYGYFDSIYDVLDFTEDQFLQIIPSYDGCKSTSFNYQLFHNITLGILTTISTNMDTFKALSGVNAMSNSLQIKMDFRDKQIFQKLIQSIQPNITNKEKELLTQYTLGGRWRLFTWWAKDPSKVTVDTMMDAFDKVVRNMAKID